MWISIVLLAFFSISVNGYTIHQDTRCNCICPDPSVSQAESINANADNLPNDPAEHIGDRRSIYINSTVSPDDCNCPKVVLIHLNLTDAQADSFCPRCSCKYQTRSLATIKVVVIFYGFWYTMSCCFSDSKIRYFDNNTKSLKNVNFQFFTGLFYNTHVCIWKWR